MNKIFLALFILLSAPAQLSCIDRTFHSIEVPTDELNDDFDNLVTTTDIVGSITRNAHKPHYVEIAFRRWGIFLLMKYLAVYNWFKKYCLIYKEKTLQLLADMKNK